MVPSLTVIPTMAMPASSSIPPVPPLANDHAPPDTSPHQTQLHTRAGYVASSESANAAAQMVTHFTNMVLDPLTGNTLQYEQLKTGPQGTEWIQSMVNEIRRLTQGIEPHMPMGTETMHFIHPSAKPAGHTTTYLHIVASKKPNKSEPKCIHFTVGGD